jgi:hypothetical protein
MSYSPRGCNLNRHTMALAQALPKLAMLYVCCAAANMMYQTNAGCLGVASCEPLSQIQNWKGLLQEGVQCECVLYNTLPWWPMAPCVHRVNDVLQPSGRLLLLQAPPAFRPDVWSQLLQLLMSCPQYSAAVEAAPAATASGKAPRALGALMQLVKPFTVRGSQ